MKRFTFALVIAIGCTLPAWAEGPATTRATAALGSIENPVKCDDPAGEREYLSRLRDAAGRAPKFVRNGSRGMSPCGHITDYYTVTASDGTRVGVYLDMYHPSYRETEPVPGFLIVAP